MAIMIDGLEMPKENERLDIVINPNGKVTYSLDLECKQIAIAKPVKRGEWVKVVERVDALGGYWVDVKHIECSECHVRALRDCYGQPVKSNYCPNCGARMDLGKVGE